MAKDSREPDSICSSTLGGNSMRLGERIEQPICPPDSVATLKLVLRVKTMIGLGEEVELRPMSRYASLKNIENARPRFRIPVPSYLTVK